MSGSTRGLAAAAALFLLPQFEACGGDGDVSTALELDASTESGGGRDADDPTDVSVANASEPTPLAPTAPVGTLPGGASVDAQGQAQFVLPLTVPPGAAGIQPELALSYTSGGPDGLLGVGWRLQGISTIGRCAKTLAEDGVSAAFAFESDDALCWNGERLIPVVGLVGADGTEYRTRVDRYARIVGHGDALTDGSWFEVFTKDGRILRYGKGSDARVRRNQQPYLWAIDEEADRLENSVAYTYVANQVGFSEGSDIVSGDTELRPLRIDYTNFGTVQGPRSVRFGYLDTSSMPRRVGWTNGAPTTRSRLLETISTYSPGDTLVRTYHLYYDRGSTSGRPRLNAVQACDAAGVCLPATRFTWANGSTGAEDIVLDGDGSVASFDGQNYPLEEPGTPPVFQLQMDYDGDTGADLLYLSQFAWKDPLQLSHWQAWLGLGPNDAHPQFTTVDTGVFAQPAYLGPAFVGAQFRAQAIDFNSDRRDDIVHIAASAPQEGGAIQVFASGQGEYVPIVIDDGSDEPILHAVFPDLDGDGHEDVLLCRETPEGVSHWVFGLHAPVAPAGTLTQSNTFDFTGGGFDTGVECSRMDEYVLLDADGNHTTDLLVIPATVDNVEVPDVDRVEYQRLDIDLVGAVAALRPSGLPRDLVQRWRNCYNQSEYEEAGVPVYAAGPGFDKLGDWNGDGLVDIARYELAGGDTHAQLPAIGSVFHPEGCSIGDGEDPGVIRIWWNTGRGFVRGEAALTYAKARDLVMFRLGTPLDWNRDGRADLLLPAPEGTAHSPWVVLVSDDEEFHVFDTPVDALPYDNESIQLVADFDGNGSHDFGINRGLMFDLWRSTAQMPDLLVTATDGYGKTSSFEYGRTMDGNTHVPETQCLRGPHDRCLRAIRPIVAVLREDNGFGVGTTYDKRYTYFGGREDRGGRGSVGFERVRTVESAEGVTQRVTEIEYDQRYDDDVQDYPFAKQPSRVFRSERLNLPGEPERFAYRESKTEFKRRDNPTFAGVWDVVPQSRRDREWDTSVACATRVSGLPVCSATESSLVVWQAQVDSQWVHDDFGNPTTLEITYGGLPDRDVVEQAFLNDPTLWVIGRPTSITERSKRGSDPERTRETTIAYDGVGLVRKITREPSGLELKLETEIVERDPHGNPSRIVERDWTGEQRGMQLVWDAQGVHPTDHYNALGHRTQLTFHQGLGVPASATDPNGVTLEWTYDGMGRLVATRRLAAGVSDGADIAITYSPVSDGDDTPLLQVRRQQAGGEDVVVNYDRLGRQTRTTWRGFGGVQSYVVTQYDPFFRPVRRSLPTYVGQSPAGYHFVEFDAAGRVRRAVRPGSDADDVHYDYQLSGSERHVTVRDEEDKAQELVADLHGNLIRSIDALGTVTCFDHGAFDFPSQIRRNCTAATPPPAITLTHDVYGGRTALTDPALGSRTFTYNAWGETTIVERTDGSMVEYQRDALGRVQERSDAAGITTYTWDTIKKGLLTESLSADGVRVSHDYDAYTRPKSTTTEVGVESFPITLGYDGFSRLQTLTYPGSFGQAFAVTQEYDAYGHLDRVRSGATIYWDVSAVDEAGRVRQEMFWNGAVTQRTYDTFRDRIDTITTTTPAAGFVQKLDYDWLPAGGLWKRHDLRVAANIQHETFSYDDLHRVTKSVVTNAVGADKTVNVTYDVLGNIDWRSDVGDYVYAGDRLASVGALGYTYDSDGRVRTRGGTTLTWTGVDEIGQISAPGNTVTFAYDADGRRTKRTSTVDGTTINIAELYERQINGTTKSHRYNVRAMGRVVTQVQRQQVGVGPVVTTKQAVHDDHLGSTDVVTGEPNGPVMGRMSFDMWGAARSPTNWKVGAAATPIGGLDVGFTGHTAKLDNGLMHMRGRMYDPMAGRFMSPDPIVAAPQDLQAYNRYSYVGNAPLRWTDPSGFRKHVIDEPFVIYGDVDRPEETAETSDTQAGATASAEGDEGDEGGQDGYDTTGGDSETGDAGPTYSDAGSLGGASGSYNEDVNSEEAGYAVPGIFAAPAVAVEIARGALLGDLIEDPTIANVAGQIVTGLSPAALLGDARDIAVAGADFVFSGGSFAAVGIAVAGVLPLGDLLKLAKVADDAGVGVKAALEGADDAAKTVVVPSSRYPETAAHIRDAQDAGHPSVLTIERGGADANRAAALSGKPRVEGAQLDEYPPAMFREGGAGASTRPVSPRDNMGAGACIGNQCRGLPDGTRVRIKVE